MKGGNPPEAQPYLALARAGAIAWNMWQRSGMDDATAQHFGLDGFAPLGPEECAKLAARCGLNALPDHGQAPNFSKVDFTADDKRGIGFARFVFGIEAPLGGDDWPLFAGTFDGATFGDRTQFDGATFGDGTQFNGATFGNVTHFNGATFGNVTHFNGATFGNATQFNGATFGNATQFDGATFGDVTQFIGATFGDVTQFIGATFDDETQFDGATFGGVTQFIGATFGNVTQFTGATFGVVTQFNGATFGEWTRFEGATFGDSTRFDGWIKDRLRELLQRIQDPLDNDARAALDAQVEAARPDRFGTISFARAQFGGAVSFANRTFGDAADFSRARFRAVPDFAGSSGHDLLDLHGIRVRLGRDRWWQRHWTTDSAVDTAIRRLRKIAKGIGEQDLERDLFVLQRQAQRGILWAPLERWPKDLWRRWRESRAGTGDHPQRAGPFAALRLWPRRARQRWQGFRRLPAEVPQPGLRENVMKPLSLTLWLWAYWLLSEFGRSLARPFVWFAASPFLFQGLYQRLQEAFGNACRGYWDSDLWSYTLGNILPFPGSFGGSRKDLLLRLFPGPEPGQSVVPFWFDLAATVQSLFGAILLFLFVMALRNRFRASGGGGGES